MPIDNANIHYYVENTLNAAKQTKELVEGHLLPVSPFVQMVVLEVIFDPTIIDENMKNHLKSLGAMNVDTIESLPRNSILAKQIADGSPGSERPPMFVYPFFAHLSLPIKPGEHVWVLMYPDLEKKAANIAYWMSRVVEPHAVDDVNHTHSPRTLDTTYLKGTKDEWEENTDLKYVYNNGRVVVDANGDHSIDAPTAPLVNSPFSSNTAQPLATAYVDLQTLTNAGKISTIEPVPRFRKRPADFVIEGSNNTLIVLGTDRTGVVAEYDPDEEDPEIQVAKPPKDDLVGSAGAIDIVVGRGQTEKTLGKVAENADLEGVKEIAKSLKNDDPALKNEGDPDFQSDRSRIYIAQRTQPDSKLKIKEFNEFFDDLDEFDAGGGAAIIKTDKVRIIARSDIEFLVSGYETDDKGNVKELNDPTKMAAVIIKKNGDIVFKPSQDGFIKLGGDDAHKAVICTGTDATIASGEVIGPGIIDTNGGSLGIAKSGGAPANGSVAAKVLVK